MNIAMTFKNFEPSDHLRKYANRRFEKLGRFLPRADNAEMTVVLTVDKFRHKADVQLAGDGIAISAVEQSPDMYATVDMVLDKLGVQLKKHVERQKEKRRSLKKVDGAAAAADGPGESVTTAEAEVEGMVIIEETVEPKPMYSEEAALQLAQRGDDVLVFFNADTGRVNVIHRRKNGNYGLIDLEM